MKPVIGMIVPPAEGDVPPEAHDLCPHDARFAVRGLGLGELTIEGYDSVIDRAVDLAVRLKEEDGAVAVSLMGTSLSFFRGVAFNDELIGALRDATGLPATTMTSAIRDALRALGARRLAVGTAYTDEVNARLQTYLEAEGFEIVAMESFGLTDVPTIRAIGEDAVVELGERAAQAAQGRADAVLISCGGLKASTLAPRLEPRVGLPVVASASAGVWASLALAGIACRAPGLGRLGQVGSVPA